MFSTILITGGAGFIGSHLARRFKADYPASRVLALDNLRRRGSEVNLAHLRSAGVEFVHGDVRNPSDLAFDGAAIDLIVECSAEPSVMAGYSDPSYVVDANLVGAINCLNLARRSGAAMIFLSTSRVYPIDPLNALDFDETGSRYELSSTQPVSGASDAGVAESFPLDGVRSLYGATKLSAELMIQEYAAAFGMPYVIDRCGVVAGPGQFGKVDQGVFALWMGMHVFGRPLKYIGWGGGGKQVRDLLHVDDLADLIEYQAEHLADLSGSVFNAGGSRACSLSLRETTALCRQISGRTVDVAPVDEMRAGDVRIYISDIAKVSAATGWSPKRSASNVLDDIHTWILANEDQLRHLWLA